MSGRTQKAFHTGKARMLHINRRDCVQKEKALLKEEGGAEAKLLHLVEYMRHSLCTPSVSASPIHLPQGGRLVYCEAMPRNDGAGLE